MGLRSMNWDDWIELDNEFLKFHSIKAARIAERGAKCCKTAPEARNAAIELLEELCAYLPERYPSLFQGLESAKAGVKNLATGETIDIKERLEVDMEDPMQICARLVQDDLAIMIERPDGQYYLLAGAILLAGFWRLEDKFQMALSEIHTSGDVPQYKEKLEKGMLNMFKRLQPEKPVLRNNYFIQVDDNLAWSESLGSEDEDGINWASAEKIEGVSNVWFRSERQSLRRLPRSGGIVFTIRTYFHPITEICKEPYVPGRLASAMRSWGDDVSRYKGKAQYADAVLNYLDVMHEKQLGVASPDSSLVKVERLSSPPPLTEDNSGVLEDGEIDEQQGAVGSLQGELQLSSFEYSALEDRYKRLERQHSELQDLASAYSECIRGFSATNGQTVSIDQLQAEAGREGLRAKALEADVLRPLIRETGGLQALISQTNVMRTLIEKAGGLRELELFVSDLRTIRDTLDELRGSRGLPGLAAEVRDLLERRQQLKELASEVDGPNGLREKAAKYEKLTKAFAGVQNTSTFRKPATSNAAMNPARARMITNTPLEADPDRDLYEAPPPVAQPNNRTGSNNTPLGAPQDQPLAASLKRKSTEHPAPSMPTKRPRVDVGRASALLQASLSASGGNATDRVAGHNNPSDKRSGVSSRVGNASSARCEPIERKDSNALFISGVNIEEEALALLAAEDRPKIEKLQKIKHFYVAHFSSYTEMRTALERVSADVKNARGGPNKPSVKVFNERGKPGRFADVTVDVHIPDSLLGRPSSVDTEDWMRTDVCFGHMGFSSAAGPPRYSSTPPVQDVESHTDARLGPVRFPTAVPSLPAFSSHTLGIVGGAQTALQAVAAVPADPHLSQMTIWKDYLRHAVAFWVGPPYASVAWDTHQLYDMKRNFQIPGDLLASLTGQLSSLIPVAKYSVYETIVPNHDTCILRYLIDGHRPSGGFKERLKWALQGPRKADELV
ncbi:hypothetical protein E8E11_011583 [Didymella keratinophila]|nr:hypothetical protein E8E11_011583 [Didymella keratinophila]